MILIITIFSTSLAIFLLFTIVGWKNSQESGDWGGKLERRFNWKNFKMEWGRFQYRTNAFGETIDSWWKQEKN